jgi:1-acyl-sn-glycerol-3-phosphate acyltransferase
MEPRAPTDRRQTEEGVLLLLRELSAELGGGLPPAAISLDDRLERDLGLSSLERVELLLRVQARFGVELPDAVLAEAERGHDLVAALLGVTCTRAPEPAAERVARAVGRAAPESARTLVDALRAQVEATPERTHIVLREPDKRERAITYGELWERSVAVAAGLRERGVERGATVALMLRTEEGFFSSFFGTLLAGGIPVPLYPPVRADRIEDFARRQAAILRNAGARVLVTFAEAERAARLLRGSVPELRAVLPMDRLAVEGAAAPPALHLTAEDPALIQYTSGSTGDPKGVLLTHANVLANLRAISSAIEITADDVGVSWLPLYHDMGLIACWLGAIYFGIPIVLLSPLSFLARPVRWLRAIQDHGATLSAAPNFAFDLCARRIADGELGGLDLRSWRVAFNGSEAVSPDTIERFVRRFEPYGFRREAMCPVYGLAEASVDLTVSPIGRGARVESLARAPFERSRQIHPADPDEQAPLRFVSCGRPLPGHDVRIVDAAGRPLPERVEGGIQFRGPSVTPGYFRNSEATRAVVRDGWMDSGDLGYWSAGELVVTGRRKDLVIQAGRNVYPQEVEEIAAEVPRIRRGCVAAFGVPDPRIGTERLVVVAETRETDPGRREQLRSAVVDRVAGVLGNPPDRVVITGPGTILKTPSGKIRRHATREALRRGELERPRPSARAQYVRLLARALRARAAAAGEVASRALFTGWLGLLLLLTLPPLWLAVAAIPRGRRADRLVRRWARAILAVSGCRLTVDGAANLDGLGAAVLVANHASYVDSVVLMAALPVEFRFVAKRRLLRYPVIGTVIERAGHLPVEKADLPRRLAGADEMTRTLREGRSLLVFPEGTFLAEPMLLPFRLGAFRAAVFSGRPVLPVAIRGTRGVLPAYARLARRGPIHVEIRTPLWPRADGWREMVRLRDRAREEIARAAGQPTGAVDALPGQPRASRSSR